eukprot:contig_31708_g7728
MTIRAVEAGLSAPRWRLPVDDAHVVWITFVTILPLTVVTVFDAVDRHYRRRFVVAARLLLSSVCLVTAYVMGGWFVKELLSRRERWDQVATTLVAMFVNWYVFSTGFAIDGGGRHCLTLLHFEHRSGYWPGLHIQGALDTTLRARLEPPSSYNLTLCPMVYELLSELRPGLLPYAQTEGQPGTPPTSTADEGMQDIAGEVVLRRPLLDTSSLVGIETLVYEKTAHVPHQMSSLWYRTTTFYECFHSAAYVAYASDAADHVRMPLLSTWYHLAEPIRQRVSVPLNGLSGADQENYACELASTSLLLVNHSFSAKFKALVDQIYQDGLAARRTAGWSGLLSCFSCLWTRERVHIAACNGLSLLALQSASTVEAIPHCVRALLVAYVSYAVSSRAVGRRIATTRQAELFRRYQSNMSCTCRGGGLDAIRRACTTLGLPAVASYMDGLPSFAAGWCIKYLMRQQGNQPSSYGTDHEEVERRLGSSTTWRYPPESPFSYGGGQPASI